MMKKSILVLIVILLLVVGGVWGILFTKGGNELLKPRIEALLNEKLPVPVKLKNFTLSPLDIELGIGKESKITAKGEWSLLGQDLNISYDIDIARLEELEPLTGQKLRGPLHTWGRAFGKFKDFKVQGQSDLAKSRTSYDVGIRSFEPANLVATIQGARVEDLLYMADQPRFAIGAVDAKANVSDFEPEHLQGVVHAWLKGIQIDRGVMKKSFGVDLPKTRIEGDLLAKTEGSQLFVDSKVDSNLLKVLLKGTSDTKTLSTDMKYSVDVKELALLKPLTKMDLRGPVDAKGTITGDKKRLKITGITHVAGSSSDYELLLTNLEPASLQADIQKARLAKILYMVGQPRYADASIDSTIKLDNLAPKSLHGSIVTRITQGRTYPKAIQKAFDIKGADVRFSADQKSLIQKGVVTTDLKVDSSVAKLVSNKAIYDINHGTFDAKYEANIPDLAKLFFLTNQKMRGALKITGEAKKNKDLLLTAHTDTLGGSVDAKLLNEKLQAHIKNIQVVQLTHMLYYPKVFDSSMSADMDYDIATKKGKLLAKAYDGRILPNQMTFLLKQMANFDITKEIYKLTELNSTIDDKLILSDLDMKSRLTHISSHKALMDLAKRYVDAKLRIDIQHKPIYVKIKGAIDGPKVSIDAKSLVKQRAKKELKKRLENKLPGQVKGLLNMF